MKTKKENSDPENKMYQVKPVTNAGGKLIVVGPEEYEEDLSMELRMKEQPLDEQRQKEEE